MRCYYYTGCDVLQYGGMAVEEDGFISIPQVELDSGLNIIDEYCHSTQLAILNKLL